MFRNLFSFLYEYVVGKDVKLKDAWKNHKKRLFVLLVSLCSILLNVQLWGQVSKYREAYVSKKTELQNKESEIKVLKASAQTLRQTNLGLSNALRDLKAEVMSECESPGTGRQQFNITSQSESSTESRTTTSSSKTKRSNAPKAKPNNQRSVPNRKDRILEMLG